MKWLYRIVCAILVVVMLVSAWKIWSIMSEYKEGEDAYHDIEQFITIPSPTPAPSDAGAEPSVQPTQDTLTQFPVVDFDSLQQMNSDVVGWIGLSQCVGFYRLAHDHLRPSDEQPDHVPRPEAVRGSGILR